MFLSFCARPLLVAAWWFGRDGRPILVRTRCISANLPMSSLGRAAFRVQPKIGIDRCKSCIDGSRDAPAEAIRGCPFCAAISGKARPEYKTILALHVSGHHRGAT